MRRHAIGYLALFVALGGTAWAGSKIGPSDIKDDAVRSRHVKGDTLVGSDIDESTLKVVRAFDANIDNPTSDETVFAVGDVTLTATCAFTSPPDVAMSLEASSDVDGKQEISYQYRQGTGAVTPSTSRSSVDATPSEIASLASGASFNAHGGGTFVFHSANEVVTATFRFVVENNCRIAGTVQRADL